MKKSKIALVTGGSRGLGRDMVIKLAKKGIDLIFTYHSNQAAANEVMQEVQEVGQKVRTFQLDSSDCKTFKTFFTQVESYLLEEYGHATFDFLINNAGTGIYQPFEKTTEDQFDEMVNIHFKGVYFLTQAAVPFINENGRIINISSGLTRFTFPNASAYATAKGAVEVFTRYLAKELSDRKIGANIVAPGAVATDFGGGENKTNEKKREALSKLTALGRVGEPEDIGGVVAFLCTEDAQWVNGQRIEVAGGVVL